MNIIKVKNIKFRDALMNREEGETVYCEEENTCYTWSNNSWNEVSSTVDAAGEIKVNYREILKWHILFQRVNPFCHIA